MPRTPSSRRSRLAAAGLALVLAGAGALATSNPASAGAPAPDLLGSSGNVLLAFSSAQPGAVTQVTVTEPDGFDLLGIDVRPATQVVYGVFIRDDGQLGVATINHTTGAVGTMVILTADGGGPVLLGSFSGSGVDFNPVADRLRFITDADDNLRINVDTGVTVEDTFLDGEVDGPELAIAAGYTNSTPGPAPATTTLYDVLDLSEADGEDSLAIQNPPNEGTLTTVGELGIDVLDFAGLEVAGAANTLFLAASTSIEEQVPRSAGAANRRKGGPLFVTALYTLNAGTGAATLVGTIGDGNTGLDSLTSFPTQLPATTTTTLATTTTAAVSPTTVLARTGNQEASQGLAGAALLVAGGVVLVVAARLRRRQAG